MRAGEILHRGEPGSIAHIGGHSYLFRERRFYFLFRQMRSRYRVHLNWALRIIIAFLGWGGLIECHEMCYISWCSSFPYMVILPGRAIHGPFHFFKGVDWCFHQSWMFNLAGEESQVGLGREKVSSVQNMGELSLFCKTGPTQYK